MKPPVRVVRAAARALLAVWIAVALLSVGASGRVTAAAPEAPARPKLLVVLVIDQFRADYLARFRSRFGPNGFERLLREGAYFASCFYPYAETETAVGHATIATGTTPDRHGIVSNAWYDPRRKRVVRAVEDDQGTALGASSKGPGLSPRNLLGSTLADELRLATLGAARVYGVAVKERAAILSTGQSASAAYWFDYRTGHFLTSSYYLEALPGWVASFNARGPANRYAGKNWKIGERVVVDLTTRSGEPDVSYYENVSFTPYASELTLEFTRELIEQERVGTGSATDFLFVGLSANDYIGHRWGPYSEEVEDMTARTDALLADFLSYLDRRFGKGGYWLVLAADHGVAPKVVQARARKLSAKNVESKAVLAAAQEALNSRWGQAEWFIPRAQGTFDREVLRAKGVTLEEAARVAGEAAMSVDGVTGYVAADSARTSGELERAVRLSRFPGRSPDVTLLLEPFAYLDDEGIAMHGTPYAYDTHVPVILRGEPFKPGVYTQRISPTDIAPTLAHALGINPPALATGRILSEALAAPARTTPSKKTGVARAEGR